MDRLPLRIAVFLVGLIAAACAAPPDEPADGRIDLILITLDTTRADRIGVYGHDPARTPEIDALANRGVRFQHAFTPAPVTLPSHASLLTGLYPPAHGARVNGSFSLDPARVTLAERLKETGYRTGAFVGAFPLDSRFGLDRGFDVYDDRLPARGRTLTFAERDGGQVTDAALGWIRENADAAEPLFLWTHYFDPHAPYAAPDGSTGYDGEIAYTDAQIGRLLRGFDEARSLSRALVVLTADHGESLGEHGEDTHSIFLYDATLRIPLILAHPTIVGQTRVVDDRIVSLVDVVPTLLDLLGMQPAGDVDGRNLLVDDAAPDRAIYFETLEPLVRHGWAPMRGLRNLEVKLIEAPEAEYFDIVADSGELRNLFVDDLPAIVDLQDRLVELYGPTEELTPEPVARGATDRETHEQLEALGYVRTHAEDLPARRRDPKRMLPLWGRIEDFDRLTRAGRSEEALRLIDEIVAADPGNGRAWLHRGMLLQSIGRLDEAEESVRRSVRVAPDTDSWARLAEILYGQGRFAEGDAAVAEVRRIEPQSGQAYVAEGIGAVLQGRYEDALRAFDLAQQVDPANSGARAAELAELPRQMR